MSKSPSLSAFVDAAWGKVPADLVFRNARVVNVLTGDNDYDESSDSKLLRSLAIENRRDVSGLQHLPKCRSNRDPHGLQVHGVTLVVGVLGTLAAYFGQRTLECPYDVGDGDLRSRPGKAISTRSAALGGDETGPPEVDQQVLDELHRKVLAVCDDFAAQTPWII